MYKDLGEREYRLTCLAHSPDETSIGGQLFKRQALE